MVGNSGELETIFSGTQASEHPTDPPPQIGSPHGITMAKRTHRAAGMVKWISAVLIVLALFVLIRALPVDRAIDLVKAQVAGLGFWGPLALGAAYVVAALAFFPGSALTLTAGAVFGLVWGTVTVSLASTTAAALAFLIARYVARDKVARQAQRFPKFEAIDRAIGDGGWKIIAMLRLSPAVPFSLGNYLFGLTAIRFWPYVMASWLFMLPGTLMYVYLGHVGTEGLRSAAGAQRGKTPGEWALLAVGLMATIAVTIYVTRLARKALRQQTNIEGANRSDTESARSTEHTTAGAPGSVGSSPMKRPSESSMGAYRGGTYTPSIRARRRHSSRRSTPAARATSMVVSNVSSTSSASPMSTASQNSANGSGFTVHGPPATMTGCASVRSSARRGISARSSIHTMVG